MNNNPFADANMAAFGGQMAQAWQQGLESWWKNLLGDAERMRELGRHLGEQGLAGGSNKAGAQAQDLGRVLQALELMDQRMAQVEEQVAELAKGLAAVAEHLAGQSKKARK